SMNVGKLARVHSYRRNSFDECWKTREGAQLQREQFRRMLENWGGCTAPGGTVSTSAGKLGRVHSYSGNSFDECWKTGEGAELQREQFRRMLEYWGGCRAAEGTVSTNAGKLGRVHSSRGNSFDECWKTEGGGRRNLVTPTSTKLSLLSSRWKCCGRRVRTCLRR